MLGAVTTAASVGVWCRHRSGVRRGDGIEAPLDLAVVAERLLAEGAQLVAVGDCSGVSGPGPVGRSAS